MAKSFLRSSSPASSPSPVLPLRWSGSGAPPENRRSRFVLYLVYPVLRSKDSRSRQRRRPSPWPRASAQPRRREESARRNPARQPGIRRSGGDRTPRGVLPGRTSKGVRGHVGLVRQGPAHRPHHGQGRAHRDGRVRGGGGRRVHRPLGQDRPDRGQPRLLREDRPREGAGAPADRGGQFHRPARLRAARRRRGVRRRVRAPHLRRHRAAKLGQLRAREADHRRHLQEHRGAVRAAGGDHRHPHRLRRPRPDDQRLPVRRPGRPGGTPLDGKGPAPGRAGAHSRRIRAHAADPAGLAGDRPRRQAAPRAPGVPARHEGGVSRPYLLGLLLGDGSLHSHGLGREKPATDPVSVDGLATRARPPARLSTIRLAWEHYGLPDRDSASFIPEDYLHASASERLDLVRGLLDAGGEVVEGERAVDFTAPSARLADSVTFIVRSLGGIAARQDGLRLRLRFPDGVVPISSKPHLARWHAGAPRPIERFIEAVEPAGARPCQCILLDSEDHLYVTSDFVVTHNTACCLNIATHVGCRGKYQNKRCGVGIFSLEMTKEQLVMRMLSSEARVDSQRIRTGKLIESDWAKLANAAGVLADANIHIDDTPAISALELRAKCRRLFSKYENSDAPIRLVIVDYLQLMRGNERIDSREQQISEISRSLKALAKELGIPVLALSQLNRSLEKRPDKRPLMSDLRECVTGETLVCLANGRRSPILDLVGTTPRVLAMSPDGRIV